MAASEGSTRVIVFALFANLGIAITKFAGAVFTKSASMMVSVKVLPGKNSGTSALIRSINTAEKAIKLQFPEIKWLFVEPDNKE